MTPTASRVGAAPLLASTWILIRLRLRRLANQLAAAAQTKKRAGVVARTGNAGKKSTRVVLYLMWPLMFFVFGSIAVTSVINLHEALDAADTFWLTVEFSSALTIGVAFLVALMWTASLLVTIGSGELAKADWDLEWLITLPIRTETLLWARILERSVVNPSGVLSLFTICTVVAWFSGYRWTAPLAGALTAWPLLLLAAVARTLVDTGLRLHLRPAKLRNLHAVISVLSIVTMYLTFSVGMKGKAQFMLGVAAMMPDWLRFTPAGLAVRALNERAFTDTLVSYGELLLEAGSIAWLGVYLLRRQLRHGVIAGGARESGRDSAPPTVSMARSRSTALPLSAIQRRELTLLSRDRNFLVQSLVLPLLLVGGQVLLGSSGVATSMWHDANVLGSVAFGLAAYSLSMSAFQTLNTEGQALWLLFTFPLSIEGVLKDKAKLWGVITLAYPLALFGVGAVVSPGLGWDFLGAILTVLLGIPIYAFIAVALGVYGSNPLEQQQNQKVKPAYMYLYMLLAGLYVYAIVTPHPLQRLVFMVLSLLLAFALWQKARDQLAYLLDPDASPPARVSTSDGLIAVMVFFVAQAAATAVIIGRDRVTGGAVLLAFSIGGAITYALMRYVYARSNTEGVPRILGESNRPLLGIALGLAAGVFALVYLLALDATKVFVAARHEDGSYIALGLWVAPLAVIAAPLFEEFIFRGLIFGGLRRTFGAWPATLASAAVFAIVHPAFALVPVFVMGVCAAQAYERTRSLLAPMLVHAVYNAILIGAQHFLY
jgi:ABC-2 type transport system permease protein